MIEKTTLARLSHWLSQILAGRRPSTITFAAHEHRRRRTPERHKCTPFCGPIHADGAAAIPCASSRRWAGFALGVFGLVIALSAGPGCHDTRDPRSQLPIGYIPIAA